MRAFSFHVRKLPQVPKSFFFFPPHFQFEWNHSTHRRFERSLLFFLSCMIVPGNLHSLTGSYAPNWLTEIICLLFLDWTLLSAKTGVLNKGVHEATTHRAVGQMLLLLLLLSFCVWMGSGLLLTELSFPGGSERTHFRSECPHLSQGFACFHNRVLNFITCHSNKARILIFFLSGLL